MSIKILDIGPGVPMTVTIDGKKHAGMCLGKSTGGKYSVLVWSLTGMPRRVEVALKQLSWPVVTTSEGKVRVLTGRIGADACGWDEKATGEDYQLPKE